MESSKTNDIGELLIKYDSFLLVMLGLELRRQLTDAVEQWGLGWQGQSVLSSLYTLAEYGAISQKQLADFAGIDPRNLVSVVDVLEQHNMAQRVPNRTDRRKYQIQLTAQGKTVARQSEKIYAKVESETLACLTENERRVFHDLLGKLWEQSGILESLRVYKLEHFKRTDTT